MARNPNVFKAQKQRAKGRRAYLTSQYSLIPVPRSVGKGWIPEDSQALFNYRDRGASTYDPYLNAIFPGVKRTSEERKFCLSRAEEEGLIAALEVEDVCDFITVKKETSIQQTRITFVFNRKCTKCFFVEINYRGEHSYGMRSIIYTDKERAMTAFRRKEISWMDFLPLSTLQLVLMDKS